jgi:hypothetical protein
MTNSFYLEKFIMVIAHSYNLEKFTNILMQFLKINWMKRNVYFLLGFQTIDVWHVFCTPKWQCASLWQCTLVLLGLTFVSLLHQSIMHEIVASSKHYAHCFQVRRAQCDELNASTCFCLCIEMLIGFVLSTLPNALIHKTSLLTTTFSKAPLHVNFSLYYTPFT